MLERMILRNVWIKRMGILLINFKFDRFFYFLKICIIELTRYIGAKFWTMKIYVIIWVNYMIRIIRILILIKVRVGARVYIIEIMMNINMWTWVDELICGVCFYCLIIIISRMGILVYYSNLAICYWLIYLFLI